MLEGFVAEVVTVIKVVMVMLLSALVFLLSAQRPFFEKSFS
jgi:hypothetical protein